MGASDVACRAGLAIGFYIRFHRRQPAYRIALKRVEKRQAAGTRCRMILANFSWARETSSGPGCHGGRKRCAGAWTPEPKIGLARHQQRHKSNPEYGPENHRYAVSLNDRASMTGRVCALLKAFAKFETNSPRIAPSPLWKTMRGVQFRSASIQKRSLIVSCLLKIICKCRNGRLYRATPRSLS